MTQTTFRNVLYGQEYEPLPRSGLIGSPSPGAAIMLDRLDTRWIELDEPTPDRDGRHHYTMYWWADYHPGRPAMLGGEYGWGVRGQGFHALLRRDVPIREGYYRRLVKTTQDKKVNRV